MLTREQLEQSVVKQDSVSGEKYCRLCAVKVDDQHLGGSRHGHRIRMKILQSFMRQTGLNVLFSKGKSDTSYHCDVCGMNIEDHQIVTHLMINKRHLKAKKTLFKNLSKHPESHPSLDVCMTDKKCELCVAMEFPPREGVTDHHLIPVQTWGRILITRQYKKMKNSRELEKFYTDLQIEQSGKDRKSKIRFLKETYEDGYLVDEWNKLTVLLCMDCHSMIHDLFSNGLLAKSLCSIPAIVSILKVPRISRLVVKPNGSDWLVNRLTNLAGFKVLTSDDPLNFDTHRAVTIPDGGGSPEDQIVTSILDHNKLKHDLQKANVTSKKYIEKIAIQKMKIEKLMDIVQLLQSKVGDLEARNETLRLKNKSNEAKIQNLENKVKTLESK
jgi:hypothetical protein